MEGLGELGFWLAVGIVLGTMIMSGALKERDKVRETHATLRALLEKEGESAKEVLAYLREKDAAEAAGVHARRAAWGAGPSGRGVGAFVASTLVIVLSGAGGAIAFGQLSRVASGSSPLVTMFGIWAVGLVLAALIMIWGHAGKKKNEAQPDV